MDAPAQSSARSRQGCWTCRGAKVKCDEQRPQCQRCTRLQRVCDYVPRPRKKHQRRQPQTQAAQQCSGHGGLLPTRHVPGRVTGPAGEVPVEPAAASTVSTGPPELTEPNESTDELAGLTLPAPLTGTPEGLTPATFSTSQSPDYCLPLSDNDVAALHMFQTVVAPAVDTKDLQHSVPAIVWHFAQESAMVLHMVCALGGQELCYHRTADSPAFATHGTQALAEAVEHYSSSLRLLADAIAGLTALSSLDTILATLWLMILYEQKFGDGHGAGLVAHLKGAASVLQSRLRTLGRTLDWNDDNVEERAAEPTDVAEAIEATETGGRFTDRRHLLRISPFCGRMIVWISFLDSGAALHGIGGVFNAFLGDAMSDLDPSPTLARLRGYHAIHKHSAMMCHAIWGAAYPQQQILEDFKNRPVFYLYGEAGQLRYILSQLVDDLEEDHCQNQGSGSRNDREAVAQSFRALASVTERYSELIHVASVIDTVADDLDARFVRNLRFVVCFYHAVVLGFYSLAQDHMDRVALPQSATLAPTSPSSCAFSSSSSSSSSSFTTFSSPSFRNQQKRRALREIAQISNRIHADEGDVAMFRIAWPLFLAALETDDSIHRDWMVARFRDLKTRGENYRRANEALQFGLDERRRRGCHISSLTLPRRYNLDRFVI